MNIRRFSPLVGLLVGLLTAGAAACSSSGGAGGGTYPDASSNLGVGCVPPRSLEAAFTSALGRGASVITAHGTYTGKADSQNPYYFDMQLDAVDTIGGPPLPASVQGWISTVYGANAGSLWAPDGSILAIAQPDPDSTAASASAGRAYDLTIAPLVDGKVVFSSAGCWPTTEAGAVAFSGPLQEIPGSGSYNQARQFGFRAVPLATIEQLVDQTTPATGPSSTPAS